MAVEVQDAKTVAGGGPAGRVPGKTRRGRACASSTSSHESLQTFQVLQDTPVVVPAPTQLRLEADCELKSGRPAGTQGKLGVSGAGCELRQ